MKREVTANWEPPFEIRKKNPVPAFFFGLLAILFLSPLYWTPLTGTSYLIDLGSWEGAFGALLVGWGARVAAQTKTLRVTGSEFTYKVGSRTKIRLAWRDIEKIASRTDDWETFDRASIMIVKLLGGKRRRNENIRFIENCGRTHDIQGLDLPDAVLKAAFAGIVKQAKRVRPEVIIEDWGGWLSADQRVEG